MRKCDGYQRLLQLVLLTLKGPSTHLMYPAASLNMKTATAQASLSCCIAKYALRLEALTALACNYARRYWSYICDADQQYGREKDRKLYLRLLKGRASCLESYCVYQSYPQGSCAASTSTLRLKAKLFRQFIGFRAIAKNRSYASNYCNLGQLIEVGYAAGNTSCSRSGRLNCRSAPLLDSFRFATAKLTVLLLGVPALHCLWPRTDQFLRKASTIVDVN